MAIQNKTGTWVQYLKSYDDNYLRQLLFNAVNLLLPTDTYSWRCESETRVPSSRGSVKQYSQELCVSSKINKYVQKSWLKLNVVTSVWILHALPLFRNSMQFANSVGNHFNHVVYSCTIKFVARSDIGQ